MGVFSFLWGVVKGSTKVAAKGIYEVGKFGYEKRETIASGLTATAKGGGKLLQTGGTLLKDGAAAGTDFLLDTASKSDSVAGKAVAYSGVLVTGTATLLGHGTKAAGSATEWAAPHIGQGTASLATSTLAMASETLDSVAVTQSDLQAKRDDLARRGEALAKRAEAYRRSIQSAQLSSRKKDLLDRLVIGGVTLSTFVARPDAVSPQIEAAFEAAYPGLAASGQSFADAAARMTSAELPGLVASVKGKLFELQLVDHLNSGVLPAGYTASLAESATQPGWDLVVTDPSGAVSEVLQAKATDSVSYVQDALANYPAIDVVTTSEVFAQLSALGVAQSVRDSGISEAALESAVASAASGGTALDAADFLPSALGLAVISLSFFLDASLTPEQRAAALGERVGRAGVSTAAGKALMLATGTWWVGLIGGVATHWLASSGRAKRAQLEQLDAMLGTLDAVERRSVSRLLPSRS
jgi:hypothetical protein